MKNLRYLTCTEINEYDLIANSKRGLRRTSLQGMRNNINASYNSYLTSFPTIHSMVASGYTVGQAEALKNCYSVKSNSARNSLISRIITNQTTEFQAICAYCLFYPRQTIDHYIPQDEYPEYSIMVKNLLPCCSYCNETKNQYWRNANRRLFIHMYNDVLPNTQFLFATVTFAANNMPVVRYRIANNSGIAPGLFDVIHEHFDRLHLCNLYSELGTSTLLSEINTDVLTNRQTYGNITNSVLRTFLRNKAVNLQTTYGPNYWKAIALLHLSQSQQFIRSL